MNSLRLILLACLLASSQSSLGMVKGRVRAAIDTQGDIWVGQQVNLNLEVLTTGYRFSDIQFNLPEVSGGFLLQTDSTTIKLSEVTNGETWQIIRYPLALYPQKAGIINIPPIKVRFNTAEAFGSTPRDYDLQTGTLTLNAQLPPGVSPGGLVVSAPDFELNYEWSPSPDSSINAPQTVRVGDAVSLTVTQQAEGISGMLLNPVPIYSAPGLRSYPKAPVVKDKVDRGSLTGERTDSVTWMIEQAGQYEWPEIRIQWWDPDTLKLKERRIPSLSLAASAAPGGSPGSAAGSAGSGAARWKFGMAALVLVLVAGFAVWYWREPLSRWTKARAGRQKHSEPAHFKAILTACQGGSPAAVYQAVSLWASQLAPGVKTLQGFAASTAVPELETEVIELQHAMLNQAAPGWSTRALVTALKQARRRLLRKHKTNPMTRLPPLNP